MSKSKLLIALSLSLFFSCTYNDLPLMDNLPSASEEVYLSLTGPGISVATYAEDGVLTLLSNPTGLSSASAILVSDSIIYVAGASIRQPRAGNFNSYAAYWKNGAMKQLSNSESSANFIEVAGPHIYIAGENLRGVAVWKDDVITQLHKPWCNDCAPSIISGMEVVDGVVYVAGYFDQDISNSNRRPVYWKNGVINELSNPASNAITTGICISGTDVYVSGTTGGKPVYWKNGTMVLLEGFSEAKGIAVVGSDVYVAGNTLGRYPRAVYWKNGVLTTLEQLDQTYSRAFSIAVVGSDVYITGLLMTETTSTPGYWKNGVANFSSSLTREDKYSSTVVTGLSVKK